MRKFLRRRKERGQGMTEYIIIVALVAIGAMVVVTIFGDNIRALFGASANALAGDNTQLETKSVDPERIKRDITNFNEGP